MNFEEISKKFKKFSKDTVTEVQKMNEVRQLNVRINDEKKKINRVYAEMGKKLYDMYKDAPLEGFEADIQSIEESIRMMDLLQDQIRGVKGVILCPCCNMEVAATERFCSNCGNKMPEVITVDDAEEVDSVIETQDAVEAEGDVEAAEEESAGTEEAAEEESADAEEAAEEESAGAEEAAEEESAGAEEAADAESIKTEEV